MIVPVGNQRIMEAQAMPSMAQPAHLDMPEDMDVSQIKGLNNPADEIQQEIDESEQSEMSDSGSDIRKSVFDFLVTLGYPPRRLQEFKSKFVSETGTVDSGTKVILKIPDEVYGKNMPIPREKMKELVQNIEQTHGMSFTDYSRANEELILNFISQDTADQQSLENQGPGDILDKVYGKPTVDHKSAKTITELIKEGDNKRFRILQALLGDR